MKLRRIKFVWSSSKIAGGRWHLGLFGLYDRGEGHHEEGLAVSLRGLVGWTGVAAVAAYLAFATALFWFWQRNPYSLLTFSDAFLRPIRREAVRDLQGQAFIAQGTDSLRAKRYGEAVALLRQGLAYHPGDLKARLTLAQFYVAANQRLMALKLLQEGLGYEFPGRIYLQGFLDVAEQGEDYDLVVRTCDRYLPRLQSDTLAAERPWLLARKFAALNASGNFAAALALANAEEPGDGASEHRVLALLGSNRREDALAALAEWGRRLGADGRAVLRLRARALREAGRFDEMDPVLEQLRALSPADPQPYVFGVVQRAMGGREQAALAAFNDYIFRFGGTTQNLQLIATPLAEIGQVALVERCAAAAADRGYAMEPYQILFVQTYVQLGNWAAAARTLTALKLGVGRAALLTQAWREWMQRVIDAASGAGDTAGPALVEFLHNRPWPMKIFRKTIEALRQAGRLETARDVVALAGGAFPASAWTESQRTEIGKALAAQEATKTTPAAAKVAGLPTEKVYFQRLDDLLRDAQWAGAEQLLRDARTAKPPPAWLATRDGDLRFAQVRLCQGRGEYSEMIAAAKLFLNGEADRARRVTEIARAVFQKGERETAVTLAKEVLRASPGYPPAQRLLNEMQPKPAGKK
jgi:tetratricopeptide (TPR) repeat protein